MSHSFVVISWRALVPGWRKHVAHACAPVTRRAVHDPRFFSLAHDTGPNEVCRTAVPWSGGSRYRGRGR